ncbi:S9 family peptidase [Solitalea sp. MAHUQ-68]|uniref:S9 family peptidase n=1 Tax=Solitalea agri TaxID=2953739 RepID=A0A9X2F272_9SPHI|nr:S9 family peptidase [Solitalea agri]MCO4292759.1 S9 family peptidase [Solitalea agri]
MKLITKLKIALPILVVLFFAFAQRQRPVAKVPQIPLEDFFKNPEMTGFKVSPDGNYISYLAPYQSRLNVFVKKIGTDKPIRVTNDLKRDIRNYFWKANKILYFQDAGGNENFQLFAVNADGTKPMEITQAGYRTDLVDDLASDDQHVIIQTNKRNAEVFDPYKIDLATGKAAMLYENPGDITGWMVDHDGKLRLAVVTNGVQTSILYRNNETDKFKTSITTDFKESVMPQFFTFDNKYVYAISNLKKDKNELVIFDLEQGKEIKSVYANPDYDIEFADYSRKQKKLMAVGYTSWKSELVAVDDEAKKILDDLKSKVGEKNISVMSISKDEDKIIFYVGADRFNKFYFYDVKSGKLDLLANTRPWLKEEHLAEMKPIKYTSRDGLTINGYLTLPVGVDPKNLPVIINPHGGPWARDEWRLNPEVQFLANRGYAVLQMNFRGSTGYGKEFWTKSFRQWGRTMQNDVSDGVAWLIKEGIADKNRIAIYGGSYGGYATLAGITLTPDLYACAVDYVGVANMFTFMKTIPPYWEPYRKMFYEMVGDPKADSVMLAEVSPVMHADKIKVPLLIAQGANDPRVNKNESDQMVEALRKRGIEVEYMVKDNEGHGFSNQENRMDFYGAMEKFFAKHLKPEMGKN